MHARSRHRNTWLTTLFEHNKIAVEAQDEISKTGFLDGGADLSAPILFGLRVDDTDGCDPFATGRVHNYSFYMLFETNLGFVLHSFSGFIANIDLGAAESDVAKPSAALKSCPRSIDRAVVSNPLNGWREVIDGQKASLISFFERNTMPSTLTHPPKLPGLHQLMKDNNGRSDPYIAGGSRARLGRQRHSVE